MNNVPVREPQRGVEIHEVWFETYRVTKYAVLVGATKSRLAGSSAGMKHDDFRPRPTGTAAKPPLRCQ